MQPPQMMAEDILLLLNMLQDHDFPHGSPRVCGSSPPAVSPGPDDVEPRPLVTRVLASARRGLEGCWRCGCKGGGDGGDGWLRWLRRGWFLCHCHRASRPCGRCWRGGGGWFNHRSRCCKHCGWQFKPCGWQCKWHCHDSIWPCGLCRRGVRRGCSENSPSDRAAAANEHCTGCRSHHSRTCNVGSPHHSHHAHDYTNNHAHRASHDTCSHSHDRSSDFGHHGCARVDICNSEAERCPKHGPSCNYLGTCYATSCHHGQRHAACSVGCCYSASYRARDNGGARRGRGQSFTGSALGSTRGYCPGDLALSDPSVNQGSDRPTGKNIMPLLRRAQCAAQVGLHVAEEEKERKADIKSEAGTSVAGLCHGSHPQGFACFGGDRGSSDHWLLRRGLRHPETPKPHAVTLRVCRRWDMRSRRTTPRTWLRRQKQSSAV